MSAWEEALRPGPDDFERDTTLEPHARRTFIYEGGDAAGENQDSITRGVRNLQLMDDLTAQHSTASPTLAPSLTTPRATTRHPRAGQQQRRVFLQCAQCGANPQACTWNSDHGLMTHMSQKHGGQAPTLWCALPSDFVKVTVSILLGRHCDERSGSRRHFPRSPAATPPIPTGYPLDVSPVPDCPVRESQQGELMYFFLRELRRASAALCRISLRHSLGREPRRSVVWSSVLGNLAPLSTPSSTGKNSQGSDRNQELERRLQMSEAGEVRDLIAKPQHTGQQTDRRMARD